MNSKKLSIFLWGMFMAMNLFAMKYQIKVLNTPTVTINDKELKVGDWFDDQAIITWSKENQAMRVLSEDNRVYTLSAKLYKEIKANKFSDFILYTKPLAARGNDSLTLIEALQEKFENNFIMLDEIVVDLSDIELPENISIYCIAVNTEEHLLWEVIEESTENNNLREKYFFSIEEGCVKISRNELECITSIKEGLLWGYVYIQIGQDEPIMITRYLNIQIFPMELDTPRNGQEIINSMSIIIPSLSTIDSLINKAEVSYYMQSNDSLALCYVQDALECAEIIGIKGSYKYGVLLSLLCQYGCDEREDDFIRFGEDALAIFKYTNAPSQEVAKCLLSLAYCYSLTEDSLGLNSQKSVDLCLNALNLLYPNEYEELYAKALSTLAGAYISHGKYHDAIKIADKCITYADSCLKYKEKHTIPFFKLSATYSLALHNKAMALYYLGNFLDSITYNKINIQFRLDTWGKSKAYAISLINLARVEELLGLYKEALRHYQESYKILLAKSDLTFGEAIELTSSMVELDLKSGELFNARKRFAYLQYFVNYSNIDNKHKAFKRYINTALRYWTYLGNRDQAHGYLHYAYTKYDSYYFIDDDVHIQTLINTRNDSLAYYTALDIQNNYENLFGESNYITIGNFVNIIKASMAIRDWETADSCIIRYAYGMKDFIKNTFPIITSENRELMLKEINNSLFYYIPSVLNFMRTDGFSKVIYDLTLLHKGLLINTERDLLQLINNTLNENAIDLYNEILNNNILLRNSNNITRKDSISNVLQRQIKHLQHICPGFEKNIQQLNTSWEDIRNHLEENEVAVEFIDIIDHNTGNKSCKALIITHNCNSPYYIDLFNEVDLHNIDKEDYYNTYKLFALTWDPILVNVYQEEQYQKKYKVYFSTSGLTSQIALESLLDYDGRRVTEYIDFYRLSSTKELIEREHEPQESIRNAYLYGGLKYDSSIKADSNTPIPPHKQPNYTHNELTDSFKNSRAGLYYLPATKIEVELIDQELRHKSKHSTLMTGTSGTEKSFIALDQKETNILHIATHGYYWKPSELDSLQANRDMFMNQLGFKHHLSYEEKAMIRSGLFLSGANVTLIGEEPSSSIYDGIVTAYEISKLNFKNLNLVVLSACDTGLGEFKAGEGVLGLQRGFKIAGAKSILMSLWKVDDSATQMLMVEFYKNFLNGETKAKSLLKAQQHVKSQPGFEDPEYWAGFILLDGLN